MNDAKPLTFELAGAAHVDLMAALHAESFDGSGTTAWGASALRDLCAMPGAFAYIAVREGDPVGFVLCRSVVEECEILTLAVIPGHRRSGVATALLASVKISMAASGAENMFLEVAADNPGAQMFYGSLGFNEIGRRRKYYERGDGVRVDARVLGLTPDVT